MSDTAPVIVLGAGCAGLSAAYRLQKRGRRVVVVEAEDHPGGLAGGVTLGGSIYEYGPHVFHTTDPELLADVKALMGRDLVPYERTIRIRFLGRYFQFPLSVREVLLKLPPWTVAWAAVTFAYRFAEGFVVTPEVETSETVLRRYYGDVLYRIFFRDYIEHVWGIPPSGFSPSFARERIPRFNVLEWTEKLYKSFGRRSRAVGTRGFVEKVEGELYTTREGFSMITRRMAERLAAGGAELVYSTRVVGLEREGASVKRVIVESGGARRALPCSAIVNTLPINEAARLVSPSLSAEALNAAAELRFRAIIFVGLKVKKPRALPASFMYFREHSFNRITDLSHFGFDIQPNGMTLLVAEVTCDADKDTLWSDEKAVTEAVLSDLEREALVSRADVEETHVFRARHAHPIYALGYEKALETLLAAFAGLSNAETAGRQGRFQYVNTHVAMKMGYEAADRLHARLS